MKNSTPAAQQGWNPNLRFVNFFIISSVYLTGGTSPGNNRVFYFYYENNTFVLLHHFRKKTQKTPQREIEQAKAERNDYLRRKEAVKK